MRNHTPQALAKARQLRREMSLPEGLLWNRLRRRPLGVKFRSQHPFADFVLDFYCAANKLAIEIDGIAHEMGDRPSRDAARAAALAEAGITVLRIPASEVLADADGVAESIARHCADIPPPSALRAATSPAGGDFSGVDR